MLKYFKNWKNLNRHKTAFSSLWLMISNRYIYNTNIQCSNKSIVVSVEWYWYSYSIFIFISIYPNSVHIITHNNCTVLAYVWSVAPPDKVPRSPFFLQNGDDSEKFEEFPFVRRSGGLSNEDGRYYYWLFNHWKSCVWWVCYNQIYLIDRVFIFKFFNENLSEKQRTIIIPGLCQILENEWFDTWDCLKLHC